MTRKTPVAAYYESNTRRFLLVGRSGGRYTIHRQLWGPGVRTPGEAAGYVNELVAERVLGVAAEWPEAREAVDPERADLRILDMGCGVGGTLFALAERFPEARLHGVTISPGQHEIAMRVSRRKGLAERCRFTLEDFQTLDPGAASDVVVAIESFVHSDTPERFLSAAASHLTPGGRLILIDDFLARGETLLSDEERERVERFRRGWHARSVCTVARCAAAAREVGIRLVENRDLTPLVRPGHRLRDRWIARLSPLFVRLGLIERPFFANMIGGGALQAGLAAGFMQYRLLVFEKE